MHTLADKDKDVDVFEAIMSPSPVMVHGVVIGGVLPMKTSKTMSSDNSGLTSVQKE